MTAPVSAPGVAAQAVATINIGQVDVTSGGHTRNRYTPNFLLGGYFQLNTMLPVIAYNLLQSLELLASAASVFADRCVAGITANVETCAANIERALVKRTPGVLAAAVTFAAPLSL